MIDARGRPLTTDAIVVRNLTREAELFVPLIALSNPEIIVPTGPGWVQALSALWLAVFMLIPLINRERRRVGDLLAGTLVVRDPRATLQRDMAHTEHSTKLTFSAAQLEMYGVYELQVLEDILRDEPRRSQALNVVAKKPAATSGASRRTSSDPGCAHRPPSHREFRARCDNEHRGGP